MKLVLALLITLSLSAEEFYLQPDKQKHFVGSMAIGGVATGIAMYYGSNKFEAVAIGIASALLIGIAKEAIDGRGYGTEDIGDVYADTIGAVSGSIISTQFNWRF
jgi:VanZ family protein